LATIAMLLVSLTTWDHYFLLLLLPLALLWADLRPGNDAYFSCTFALVVLPWPIVLTRPAFVGWWALVPLLLPIELLSRAEPLVTRLGRWWLRLMLLAIWPSAFVFTKLFMGAGANERFTMVARPIDVLVPLAIPTYGLLALFAMLASIRRRHA
jgi:hypothetical protein